jgi:hypothetical protein
MLTRRCGPLEVELDPGGGGRLAVTRYEGVDVVLPPGRVPGFHGDTFWPSPQSLFDWPPPPVLDAGPYEVLRDEAREVLLRSGPDPQFGLQVEKRFTIADHALAIDFTMTNTWPRPHALAAWQVTRAPRRGLLVWATGEPFTDADRVRKHLEDPGCWYFHAQARQPFEGLATQGSRSSIRVGDVTRISKYFTDARGWLAHVHDGVAFLRAFPDLVPSQVAPRQGEVELYFNPERDYIELENQGPYGTLAPGARTTYSVTWHFARLDPDLPDDRVTPGLLAAIDQLRAAPAPGPGGQPRERRSR